ncbi:MAG TPA: type II toxin-antitoxin system RelE/ParE family toxin [Desulfobacteria bacterium]|nr:type II toxin-antitoxin system RelE/ParE family toxin [Desulfobacteria bacterium]
MTAFELYLSTAAKAYLKKLDKPVFERIYRRINALAVDPYPADAKRVRGRTEKVFRVRVGDYRILYVIYGDTKRILIVMVDKRAKVYER